MRDMALTRSFYRGTLGFRVLGEYKRNYLMVGRDDVEIHLFLLPGLLTKAKYGMPGDSGSFWELTQTPI
jgi:catechol 2,3-dioxygenase-like lactoylglutathione lyase family enzyme